MATANFFAALGKHWENCSPIGLAIAAVETAVRIAAAEVLLQFHDPQIAYRKREVKPVYVQCRIHNSFLRAHNAGHIPIAYARDEDVQGARILSAIKHSGHCGLPLSLAD